MKTPEELSALKAELEALNARPAELTDDELAQVAGGAGDAPIRFELCMLIANAYKLLTDMLDALPSPLPYLGILFVSLINVALEALDSALKCLDANPLNYAEIKKCLDKALECCVGSDTATARDSYIRPACDIVNAQLNN